ncbi:MAG: peptidase hydrogen uptake protein [Deltaproteobacteria bacterium]|nr:peptidase hydrogen uptake protein [Deltaproteobacteria bacterium]
MSTATATRARIAVIGLGNVLFGDDGFGPFVLALLHSRWEFSTDVTLVDVGTPGLDLVTYLQGREAVILVDAVGATGRPGELRRYRNEELTRMPAKPRVSPHDPAVQETLLIAQFAGDGPRHVLLIGTIPLSLEQGAGLSAPIHDAASTAAAMVVDELATLGAAPALRPEPVDVDPWWMRAPATPSSHAAR